MAGSQKAQQIFLYVAPFPALVFFKVWAASGREPASLLAAACMMLGYCALVIGLAYRWDKPTYFDWAIAAYFALAAISLSIWTEAAGRIFTHYAVTGIYTCLFAAAFFPPLFGLEPFTCHYARKYTPQDAWENPIFITINRIMTYVWAAIFAVCMALSLYPSVLTRALIPVSLVVGFGLPFNLRFPDHYLRRLGLPSLAEQRRMAQDKPLQGKPVGSARQPTNAWEAVTRMPDVFDPAAAGDLSSVIGFIVSGSETFEAYIQIQNHVCNLIDPPHSAPDLLIRTPSDVWLAISRGELDGQRAFAQKAFTAQGNLGILMRMNRLFSRRAAAEPGPGDALTGDGSPPHERETRP